jgi:sugar porter (SP) family MFS transporter
MKTKQTTQGDSVKPYVFYIAFVASLGGLLFGFDTAVISGAEKAVQQIYELSNFAHGFTIAIALIGTIVGAFFCSKPVERFGRLKALKVIAFLYFFSALGTALIINWYSFVFFRFLGGIAVGASSVVGPMYIAEISPSHWRGRFVAFFQFNIVLGIVLAYLSNYSLHGIPDDWRWMLGILALPALLFGILLFTIPESPRWLVKEGRESEAETVLKKVDEINAGKELEEIKLSLVSSTDDAGKLFQKKYRKPILYAFLIATFNQLSGINVVLYYAPRIFEMSGLFRDSAMLQSIIIGLTNLVFTMIGMVLIDKVGRKKLLYIGSVGMTIALSLVAYGFTTNAVSGYYMLVCLMGFIAFFAISLGATIWVVISEVFPTKVRSKGQVLGSMTHWSWTAILTWMFPVFIGTGGAVIFGFFAVMMALSFVFALKLPEMKNKSLEQIQKELTT